MSRVRTGGRLAAAVAVVALVLAACDPIPHPTFTIVEHPDGPVTVLGMSGDGAFAVVEATGAGQTVPSAGLWRVDRRDGTTVLLPSGTTFQRISDDGQRILLTVNSNFAQEIWVNGTVVATPSNANTHFSKDLAWGAYGGPLGQARRWETATGQSTSPETGFPRPAGATLIDRSWGISDDGNTVWFGLNPSGGGCLTRFIDLAAHRVDDRQVCAPIVAANGSAYVRVTDTYLVQTAFADITGPSQLELVNRVRNTTTTFAATHSYLSDLAIADTGAVVWGIDTAVTGDFLGDGSGCGGPLHPPCTGRIDAVAAIDVTATNRLQFPVDASETNDYFFSPPRSSINSNGRFLTYVGLGPNHPLHVLDRFTAVDETLTGHATVVSNDSSECTAIGQTPPCTLPIPPAPPLISDDGRVIVAAGEHPLSLTRTGWYEYLADPPSAQSISGLGSGPSTPALSHLAHILGAAA